MESITAIGFGLCAIGGLLVGGSARPTGAAIFGVIVGIPLIYVGSGLLSGIAN